MYMSTMAYYVHLDLSEGSYYVDRAGDLVTPRSSESAENYVVM